MTTTQSLKTKIAVEKEAQRAIQFPRSQPPLQVVESTEFLDAIEGVMGPTLKEAEVGREIVDSEGLSYKELQAKAKGLGLKTSGSKKEILERLAGV